MSCSFITKTGGQYAVVSTTITPTIASPYTAGDCLGNKFTLEDVVLNKNDMAILERVQVKITATEDEGAPPCDISLFLSADNYTDQTDKVAFKYDGEDIICMFQVADESVYTRIPVRPIGDILYWETDAAIIFQGNGDNLNIYGQLVIGTTPTFTENDQIVVTLYFRQL